MWQQHGVLRSGSVEREWHKENASHSSQPTPVGYESNFIRLLLPLQSWCRQIQVQAQVALRRVFVYKMTSN